MKSELIISHNNEDHTVDTAIVSQRNIKDGFVFNIDSMFFNNEKYENFIKEITEEFGEFDLYDYSRNKNLIDLLYENDSARLYFVGNSTEMMCSLVTKSEELAAKYWEIFLNNATSQNDINIFLHSFFMNNNVLDSNTKNAKVDDYDYISPKYYPYLNTDVLFDQFFTGPENILLLVGEAGLGKSKLSTLAIKYAHENPDKLPYDKMEYVANLEAQYINVIFVKSIDVLSNDSFWRNLEKNYYDFVIIDDIDYMLTDRDAEVQTSQDIAKNAFLNQFLSYTDGVEKNKTKFIITTNQSYDDIDSALLRKGRLFDVLELRKLDHREALEIWRSSELDEKEFNKIFNSHEILSADLGSEIAKRQNKRIETCMQNYIYEEGISKIEKASRLKKMKL